MPEVGTLQTQLEKDVFSSITLIGVSLMKKAILLLVKMDALTAGPPKLLLNGTPTIIGIGLSGLLFPLNARYSLQD